MNEDPFNNKQEKLAIRVELAKPEDWQLCKDLRILAITGEDSEMFDMTPEKVAEELAKSDQEWKNEASSDDMFSVLARNGSEAVGLGRARFFEGSWRIRNGYVKPEFRNMGIQQKMSALRLREIQKRGGIKAITGIKMDNPISLHNAEKFGFKIVEEDDGWYYLASDLTDPEVIKKIDEVLNAE